RKVVERRGRQRLPIELEVVVEAEIAGCALRRLRSLEVKRIHPLLEHLVRLRVEALALAAIGLVREDRADHSIGDLLAVDRDLGLRLERCESFGLVACQLSEVALTRETPQLADTGAPIHRPPDRLARVEC